MRVCCMTHTALLSNATRGPCLRVIEYVNCRDRCMILYSCSYFSSRNLLYCRKSKHLSGRFLYKYLLKLLITFWSTVVSCSAQFNFIETSSFDSKQTPKTVGDLDLNLSLFANRVLQKKNHDAANPSTICDKFFLDPYLWRVLVLATQTCQLQSWILCIV